MSLSTVLSNYTFLADLIVSSVSKFKEKYPNEEPFFMIKCYRKNKVSKADLNPNWRIRRQDEFRNEMKENIDIKKTEVTKQTIKKTNIRKVQLLDERTHMDVKQSKILRKYEEVVDTEILTRTYEPKDIEYNFTFIDHEPYPIESILMSQELIRHNVGKYWSTRQEEKGLIAINDPDELNLIRGGNLDVAYSVANRIKSGFRVKDIINASSYPKDISELNLDDVISKYYNLQKSLNRINKKLKPLMNDLIEDWDEMLVENGLLESILESIKQLHDKYVD